MTIYNAVSSNKRKTYFIIFLFIIFVVTFSYFIGRFIDGGLPFAGVMLIVSGLMSFFSFYYSDNLVLSLSGAKPVTKEIAPDLYRAVENLCLGAGLPIPKIYIIHDPAPNAFATGRDPKHAAVAVSTGLLEKLRFVELEGVIAHELSHIKNYDTRLMGVVSILLGSIAILSDMFLRSMWWGGSRDNDRKGGSAPVFFVVAILFAVLAPLIGSLIQLAISRRREFLADADGVLLTRYPDGLADALQKIADDKQVLRTASTATAHFFIEDPYKTDTRKKVASGIASLFSTHPPIEERIKILREM